MCTIRVYKGGGGHYVQFFIVFAPKFSKRNFLWSRNCYIYHLVKEEVKEDKSPSLYSGSDTEHIAKKKRAMFQVLYSHILKDVEFLNQLKEGLNVFFDIKIVLGIHSQP